MKYADKLKDPRWQKKRLAVMERDGWTCQRCGNTKKTLNVHHRFYEPRKAPWEYEDETLITLCEDCHKKLKDSPIDDFITCNDPEAILDYVKALMPVLSVRLIQENGEHSQKIVENAFEIGLLCESLKHWTWGPKVES